MESNNYNMKSNKDYICQYYDINYSEMITHTAKGKMCNHHRCWHILILKIQSLNALSQEPLYRAVNNDWSDLVNLILSKGVTKKHLLNCRDAIGTAILNNNIEMLKLLMPDRLSEDELQSGKYWIYHLAADVYKKKKDATIWHYICDLDLEYTQNYGCDDAYLDHDNYY